MIAEHAFTFDCGGERLVGLCTGVDAQSAVGVLVVVGGPQYRAGCHRQFVHLARAVAAQGVPAMRFDYRGMGDSTGDTQTFRQTSQDIAGAIDAFRRVCPSVERVVLWGLCDGASASLLYRHATADARVAGMVLLNPWVTSDDGFAKAQIRQSFQRVLQRDFWVKALTGGIDLAGALRKLAGAVTAAGKRSEEAHDAPFQSRMAAGLERFDGPVLIVLSGRDLVAMEFAQLCESDARWRALVARANVERCEIADADHTFSDSALRRRVEGVIVEWLGRSFVRCVSDAPYGATRRSPETTRKETCGFPP